MTEKLTNREREILLEVVDLYLASGAPVASAAVARKSATGLSAASIRSVMARLEKRGYLRQPHTSAGRAPTDEGFRLYVRMILDKAVLSPGQARALRAVLGRSGALEEMLAQVSRVLAQVTDQVGVALASAKARTAVRSLNFVSVSPTRVLAVVVTQGGHVESRLLRVEQPFTVDELERISSYCTHSFAGLSLAEIRARVLALMAEERARYDSVLAGVIDLSSRVTEAAAPTAGEVFVDGAEHLLERVDPGPLGAVREVLAAFVDKARLVGLLNKLLEPAGPRVLVGSEFSLDASGSLGIVVTSFELATGESGLVGVIGSKRMNYTQIIPVVNFVGDYVSRTDAGSDACSNLWSGRWGTA